MNTTHSALAAPSNVEQLRAWDGDEGAYWATHAEYFDRAVAEHHRQLLAAAAIAEADRVLDIGCGTGQVTRDAARAATGGSALGVDLSSQMLAYARQRAAAEGLANASFLQADAQVHDFAAASFDVAVSRTGAMFFGDPVAAFGNISRALAPGSRLVLLAWQSVATNEWIREISGALAAGRDQAPPPPDAPGPFSLSDPDRVRSLLTAAGFSAVGLAAVEAPMWFGHDADDAQRFVLGLAGWMLEGLDDAGRARALDALRATVAAHATPEGVLFGSVAWLITAIHPD
ncbi:MAG TPA: methyltransferase domain-containing protein [Acidimicrobiales bacterium]|jgi:SAM-dependent methyltransferase|nr:methyltransferase domain-containing protein [Acidimicrobiales bacterium]